MYVDNEVGQKYLHGDVENSEGTQRGVKHFVLAPNGGLKAVDHVFKVALVTLFNRALLHEKNADKSRNADCKTEDGEKLLPFSRLCHAVEKSENQKHGDKRQNCQNSFHPSAVILVGNVGYVGVKGGIVGGRAEKGHKAVHNNNGNGGGRCGRCGGKEA